MRRPISLTVAAVLAVAVAPPARAADGDDLAEARAEASETAEALAEARSRLAEVERQIAALEGRRTRAERRLRELSSSMEELAVQEFIKGAEVAAPVLLDDDIHRSAKANALARLVSGDVRDTVDEYRAAADDLAAADEELAAAREEAAEATARYEEEARRTNEELRRMEREAAARARTRRSGGGGGGGGGGGAIVIVGGDGNWLCPVQGPVRFTNDWGMPRSGGRRHQGNDMLAPRGTPVVASVSGTVRTRSSSLGGLSYWLTGDDGNTYYGTHLDSYSGASGRVEKGTVLGYVGDSGNARGGPTHLHFEIQPGGGSPVNPYPTVAAHC